LGLLLNPWIFWQYLHNMIGAVVTGQLRDGRGGRVLSAHAAANEDFGRTFVRLGVIAGIAATVLMLFPTGDGQGKNIACISRRRWPPWRACSKPRQGAPLAILGQPDVDQRRLDNPLVCRAR
jgi:cytochrome bd ubiquinol oxidase subunit I